MNIRLFLPSSYFKTKPSQVQQTLWSLDTGKLFSWWQRVVQFYNSILLLLAAWWRLNCNSYFLSFSHDFGSTILNRPLPFQNSCSCTNLKSPSTKLLGSFNYLSYKNILNIYLFFQVRSQVRGQARSPRRVVWIQLSSPEQQRWASLSLLVWLFLLFGGSEGKVLRMVSYIN